MLFTVAVEARWRWREPGSVSENRFGELLVKSRVRQECSSLTATLGPDVSTGRIADELNLVCRDLGTDRGSPIEISDTKIRVYLRRAHMRVVESFCAARRRQQLEAAGVMSRAEVVARLLAEPATALGWFAERNPDHLVVDAGFEAIRGLSDAVRSAQPALAGGRADALASTILRFVASLRADQQDKLIAVLPEIMEMFGVADPSEPPETLRRREDQKS
ncbi:hypothetical protein Vqi01_52910 [Micromonospora qiuiae]|uniref:Uncharacterized protein n=1 Tax=Micromonospora qiuiae TaxID=502268 RepID=A0ABQ4JKR7_9ACTN|nr:hypothetical protein [Micromonospora qiuiae]GIJ30129.1 hypothetical protein Vqi01_52910 [Micromonospora qiuiae]